MSVLVSLGSLCWAIYCLDDDHHSVTDSTLKIFADNVTVYKVISGASDCCVLQEDLAHIVCWTIAWQVRLNPEPLNITKKQAPIHFDYTINGGVIQWKPFVCYLGIYVNSQLTWTNHSNMIASKATKLLNVLRRTMFGCSTMAKDVTFKRALLGVCLCSVESPH